MEHNFNQPHNVAGGKHTFQIDDHGLAVQLTFAGHAPLVLDSQEAMALRNWLGAAELRTQEQHDAIAAEAAKALP